MPVNTGSCGLLRDIGDSKPRVLHGLSGGHFEIFRTPFDAGVIIRSSEQGVSLPEVECEFLWRREDTENRK